MRKTSDAAETSGTARLRRPASSSHHKTRIGVLSDTHGYLDPAIPRIFSGVSWILHGGDVGWTWVLMELGRIAPVTAVLGNTDDGLHLEETEFLEVAERRFLIHHIVEGTSPESPIQRRIAREKPDVVIFGHTHRRHCQTLGPTLFFNPGYAGHVRFKLPRSVAILTCYRGHITPQYFDL